MEADKTLSLLIKAKQKLQKMGPARLWISRITAWRFPFYTREVENWAEGGEDEDDDYVAGLVFEKFRRSWDTSRERHGLGLKKADELEQIKTVIRQAVSLQIQLWSLSPAGLRERYIEERNLEWNRTEAERQEDDDWMPFNREACNVNYDQWRSRETWSLEEFVALSLGNDPDKVNWASLKPYWPYSPLSQHFKDRYDRLLIAKQRGAVEDPAPPLKMIGWAGQSGWLFPNQLRPSDAVEYVSVATAELKELRQLAASGKHHPFAAPAVTRPISQSQLDRSKEVLAQYAAQTGIHYIKSWLYEFMTGEIWAISKKQLSEARFNKNIWSKLPPESKHVGGKPDQKLLDSLSSAKEPLREALRQRLADHSPSYDNRDGGAAMHNPKG